MLCLVMFLEHAGSSDSLTELMAMISVADTGTMTIPIAAGLVLGVQGGEGEAARDRLVHGHVPAVVAEQDQVLPHRYKVLGPIRLQLGGGRVPDMPFKNTFLKRKFMSCSHCQELGQLAVLASDWLITLV